MSAELRFSTADRASKRNPCRVCGGTEWPCVNISAEKTVCHHEANLHGADGTWVENLEGWIHTIDPAPMELQPRNGSATPAPRVLRVPMAGIDVRDRAYHKLLAPSPPIPEHLDHLCSPKRGFNLETIRARNYGTGWSAAAMAEAADWCEKNRDYAFGVPGIGDAIGGDGLIPYTAPRILIPVRDVDGLIQGMQTYDPAAQSKGDRYRWLSSCGTRGAQLSPPPLHVSRPIGEVQVDEVWLTEGPFKADICSDLLGAVFVAFQGVDCLRVESLGPVLEALGNPAVVVAIDADRAHNERVQAKHDEVCRYLADRGTRHAVASWAVQDGKGLDDLLLAGGRYELTWFEPERIEDSREFIERSLVCTALNNIAQAHVLKTFPADAYLDQVAKDAARAIVRILDRGEEPNPNYVGAEMARAGAFARYQELLAFETEHAKRLTRAHKTSAAAFREVWMIDQARAVVEEIGSTLARKPFKQWASEAFAKFTPLIAEADTETDKNFRDELEEWIQNSLEGKANKDKFDLFAGDLGQAVGPGGPANVFVLAGDSKMGKTSIAWEPVFLNASQGRGVIVGGLELTPQEQCERAACWLLRRPYREIERNPELVRGLLKDRRMEWIKNIKLISKAISLDAYAADVARVCASRPGFYKLLVTDQTEMVMEFGGKHGVADEGSRVAKKFKELAKVWDLCHIALHQYRREYLEKDGQYGPRPYHIANTKKPEKDCQALIMLHRPSLFNEECKAQGEDGRLQEYIEVFIPTMRSGAGGAVVPMRWFPAEYRYEDWGADTPLPVGCGRSLDEQTRRKPLGTQVKSATSEGAGRSRIQTGIEMEDLPI